MKVTRIAVVGAIAAVALLGAGGIAVVANADEAPRPVANQVAPVAPPAVSAEQAAATAVQRIGGGQAVETELENEHGRTVWEVDVVKDGVRHDVHVDATTGAVTRQDVDDDGRDDGMDDSDDD